MTNEPAADAPNPEHLHLVLDAGRMGMWSWDALTNEVTWDTAMEARFGIDPGGFGGTMEDFLARVHPDDRAGTLVGILDAQGSGNDLAFEHRVVWPDGSVHWIEGRGRAVRGEAGEFVGMVGIGLDIDDRKRYEEAVREAASLRSDAELARELEDAQRIAQIGSWRWDRSSPEVVFSAEMRRQLDVDGPLGIEDFANIFEERAHPQDIDLVRDWQTRSAEQVQPFVYEHRIVRRGEVRHVVQRGEVLRDETGEIVGLRGTTQDVTHRKRAEESLLAAREGLARERRAVEVLQEALIRPEFPELDGFDLAARYLSAEVEADVGGDWYDAFALPDGRVMLAVGDVSGHGIRAARLMAKLRHATRAYATVDPSPERVLEQLDRFLIHFCEPEEFATVQVAALDPVSGEVELASAGHPAPLLVGVDSARFVELEGARVVGLSLLPLDVTIHRFTLEPASALLFYTDGLVERRGSTLDAGSACLATMSLDEVGANVQTLCDTAIARCLRGVSREDDVCVLAVLRSAV